LLVRSETLARSEGADFLWLTAWTGNAHALRFYEGQGYQDVGASVYTFEGDRYETRLLVKELTR
jgi:ribosomal protein S18 acetylase RimI-like enzyme